MRYELNVEQIESIWGGDLWAEYVACHYNWYFVVWVRERYDVVLLGDNMVEGTAESITWFLMNL